MRRISQRSSTDSSTLRKVSVLEQGQDIVVSCFPMELEDKSQRMSWLILQYSPKGPKYIKLLRFSLLDTARHFPRLLSLKELNTFQQLTHTGRRLSKD